MSDGQLLLLLLSAGVMVWLIIRMVRTQPGLFTKHALSKSIFTLGILALILLGLIYLATLFLKH